MGNVIDNDVEGSVHKGRDRNVFDSFGLFFETIRLHRVPIGGLDTMEYLVAMIERHLQDLIDIYNSYSYETPFFASALRLEKRTNSLLFCWLSLLESFVTHNDINSSGFNGLKALECLLSENGGVKAKNLWRKESKIALLFPSDQQINDLLNEAKLNSLDQLKSVVNRERFGTFFGSFISRNGDYKTIPYEENDTWTLMFYANSNNASQISYAIWVLSSGIETIDGVTLELLDWGKGSFWVKLKICFRDSLVTKELINILKKAMQAVQDFYLNKPIAEVEHTQAQIKSIKEDTLHKPTVEQSRKRNELELQILEQQKLTLELEYKMKQVDMIEKLSVMISKGMLQVDSDYTIRIENLLICRKEDGKFHIGYGLDQLDAVGTDETDPLVEV